MLRKFSHERGEGGGGDEWIILFLMQENLSVNYISNP